jgi:hypothetical protein
MNQFILKGVKTIMVDVIDYKIFGDDMQIVEVGLDPDEAVSPTSTHKANQIEFFYCKNSPKTK